MRTLWREGAFGNEKNPVSTDANSFRYCGEYYDKETGTYYLRARYYDPRNGRFNARDTHWNTVNAIYGDNPQKINERQDKLGLSYYAYAPQISAIMQAGNLYVYCGNSPVRYADRSGNIALVDDLFFIVVIGAGLLFTGGAVFLMTPEGQQLINEASKPRPNAPAVGNSGIFTAAGAPNPKKPDDNEDEKNSAKRNWQKADEKYLERELKKQGTNPHEIKQEYLGKKESIKLYDIYVDKNTGQLAIFKKSTGQLVDITDYYIGR